MITKRSCGKSSIDSYSAFSLHTQVVQINTLFARYQRIAVRLPKQLHWLALIFAPAITSASVFLAGLIKVIASLAITVSINQISFQNTFSMSMIWLLIIAFLVDSLGGIVKERQELLLVVVVRQLTYRRFRHLFNTSSPSASVREYALTYPGQISQFAYVVDAAVSVFQIITFLIASITMYGLAGAFSTLLMIGIIAVSLRLISLIGKLWEQYIVLEGQRRSWIQRVADSSPRSRFIPSWNAAIKRIISLRQTEETLLYKRVVLQVLNGFADRGALTVVLIFCVVLTSFLFPTSEFSIGIILAARYLYGAVQNSLANYRVIRLAIPMLRELDSLEKSNKNLDGLVSVPERSKSRIEVLFSESDRASSLRIAAPVSGIAYIPLNPQISRPVLEAWKTNVPREEVSRFTDYATQMDLSNDVIGRFWQDPSTLSSGERSRAILALVMAENPEWLILDDIFASLDPLMRNAVGSIIVTSNIRCTLITTSEEYVPKVFTENREHKRIPELQRNNIPHIHNENPQPVVVLPDPKPKNVTFRRSINLLFGINVIWIIVGAILLTGSEVAFALIVADTNQLSVQSFFYLLSCGIATIVGGVLFFGTLYYTPISRLTKLHNRILQRLDKFASPQNSGIVVARLGEDFSDLQMSVPRALGSVFIVFTQTALLVAGAVTGVPIFIFVVAIIIPFSYLAMHQGEKRIIPASTEAANRRGDFLGSVGVQAGLHTMPISKNLQVAGDTAYEKCERLYLESSVRQANAYLFRATLIQCLTIILNISAVILVLGFSNMTPLVAPAAVIFFALTLSSGIESTVETLQEIGVLGLIVERVRLLEDFRFKHTEPLLHTQGLKRITGALESGHIAIALIGKTGAGKSVILETLCHQRPEGQTVLIPEVDPFNEKEPAGSGLILYRAELENGSAQVILLDETLKGLTQNKEREELKNLIEKLTQKNKQAVVVLHSRSNLDCFDLIVDLDR